jgi:hypothetical protein
LVKEEGGSDNRRRKKVQRFYAPLVSTVRRREKACSTNAYCIVFSLTDCGLTLLSIERVVSRSVADMRLELAILKNGKGAHIYRLQPCFGEKGDYVMREEREEVEAFIFALVFTV